MERRALVLVNGNINELPIGDTLAGSNGTSEEDQVYSKRIDFISDSVLYKGEAAVGSSESSSVWRIRKITIAGDNDISETWADGVATFNKVWTDRLTYTYN